MNASAIPTSLNLKAGEEVEVRSKEEILATLDADGCLDHLPFMPEMFRFCGARLRVYKRAHKTCDTVHYTGGRRMENTVHLGGVRCDGAAHGGCQAACLIFWKEAWLKRTGENPPVQFSPADGHAPRCAEKNVLTHAVKPDANNPSETVYACQATELLKASEFLPWWDLRQFWQDYTSGNVGLGRMLLAFGYAGYTHLRGLPVVGIWFRRLYNRVRKFFGKPYHPRTSGKIPKGSPTPVRVLNLQAGELVRVKSFDEILSTIDENHYNRGLRWDAEMVPYCGGTYRVKQRIEQIVNEKTGKMLRFKSDAVILEGVVCQARYSECRYFCPRSIYPYWREIWLERVEEKNQTWNQNAKSDSK